MKAQILAVLFTAVAGLSPAADDPAGKTVEDVVFREPFTLNLHVDKENYYEEKFGKIPYVHKGNVYLFKGDAFGLTLDIKDDVIREIKYQPDLEKADVTLNFTQKVQADKTAMMMLVIRNNTEHKLNFGAIMTVPGKKGIAKTSILPVEAGLSGYESWPHPIVQLVLREIRIAK